MSPKRKTKTDFKIKLLLLALAVIIVTVMYALDYFNIVNYERVFSHIGLSDANKAVDGDFSVHYIDVGQGDCELIVSKDKTVLIDSGEYENAPEVISYIQSLGITKLDYVIGTHPHSDHIGGLPEIIQSFDIGKVIAPKVSGKMTPTTKTYINFLNAVKDKGLKLTPATVGEEYQLDENTVLKILAPLNDYDSLNNYSIVCMVTHGENKFLFMGDAEKESETDLLEKNADIDADVLKAGHHGSNSSSTMKFLSAVSPLYSVVSVGADNSYNHPSEKAIQRILKYSKDIYRTDLQGTIVCTSDGKNISFEFEKEG
ncbi:MAG TPA: ComEC/Rec2 family competence protein [Oscillospiraceae bacterium]|nr:ComEC/Rec2 family competence protein [Oscillospiraceae bacterium]